MSSWSIFGSWCYGQFVGRHPMLFLCCCFVNESSSFARLSL
uniref:Uncharacterized protein n=1 Tax=Rhizophora mucronata TaxID=61149 RepID=A0A2P2J7P4_RHIMU